MAAIARHEFDEELASELGSADGIGECTVTVQADVEVTVLLVVDAKHCRSGPLARGDEPAHPAHTITVASASATGRRTVLGRRAELGYLTVSAPRNPACAVSGN